MNERMQRTGGEETGDEDEKGGERERERQKVDISIKSVIIAKESMQQSISISRCGGREHRPKSAGTAELRTGREAGRAHRMCAH